MTNTDDIRTLENKVELGGILAELSEIREGVTKEGSIPYVSFNGAIQCGETPDMTVRFRTFVKSKKADGSESKIFAKVKNWAQTATPLTRATASNPATKVNMLGSVTDNPYVNDKGELKEATQFNMQLINDFQKYQANINLEGFIHSITDETTAEGDVTGRKKMRLIARDFFRNTLDIKNIIIPEAIVEDVENGGYERGRTATFKMSLLPNTKTKAAKKGSGIGDWNTEVSSHTFLEWVMTGASEVINIDDEKALDAKLIKRAMEERVSHLEEVKSKGYTTSKTSGGIGTMAAQPAPAPEKTVATIDEEDFPF